MSPYDNHFISTRGMFGCCCRAGRGAGPCLGEWKTLQLAFFSFPFSTASIGQPLSSRSITSSHHGSRQGLDPYKKVWVYFPRSPILVGRLLKLRVLVELFLWFMLFMPHPLQGRRPWGFCLSNTYRWEEQREICQTNKI